MGGQQIDSTIYFHFNMYTCMVNRWHDPEKQERNFIVTQIALAKNKNKKHGSFAIRMRPVDLLSSPLLFSRSTIRRVEH